jgi:hypothetical protein
MPLPAWYCRSPIAHSSKADCLSHQGIRPSGPTHPLCPPPPCRVPTSHLPCVALPHHRLSPMVAQLASQPAREQEPSHRQLTQPSDSPRSSPSPHRTAGYTLDPVDRTVTSRSPAPLVQNLQQHNVELRSPLGSVTVKLLFALASLGNASFRPTGHCCPSFTGGNRSRPDGHPDCWPFWLWAADWLGPFPVPNFDHAELRVGSSGPSLTVIAACPGQHYFQPAPRPPRQTGKTGTVRPDEPRALVKTRPQP